jgi:hypothetical protein
MACRRDSGRETPSSTRHASGSGRGTSFRSHIMGQKKKWPWSILEPGPDENRRPTRGVERETGWDLHYREEG